MGEPAAGQDQGRHMDSFFSPKTDLFLEVLEAARSKSRM